MIFAAALVLATQTGPAATPLQAAQRWVHTNPENKSATITVRAQAPNFALLTFSNVAIEGARVSGQLLAERFPFGWQLVDMTGHKAFHTCQLRQHSVDAASLKAFRAWALDTPLKPASECARSYVDAGPAADVYAVRRLMDSRNLLLSPVRVVQGYAVAAWSDGEGGENFFKKKHGRWKEIGGFEYAAIGDLVGLGIPQTVAKALLKDL